MAKTNHFNNGDFVSGKKFNGEHFVGIYEHEYDSGDHCIFDGQKKFCIHKKDCKLANDEEVEYIKENILKPLKEAEKALKRKKSTPNENGQISEDELEELLTEEIAVA